MKKASVAFRLFLILALSGVLVFYPRARAPHDDGAGPAILVRMTDATGRAYALATNPRATRLERFSCADGLLKVNGLVAPVGAFPLKMTVDVADYAAGVRSITIAPPANARVGNVSDNLERETGALRFRPADNEVRPRVMASFEIAPADANDRYWSAAEWSVVATDAFGRERKLAGAPFFNPAALCETVAAMAAPAKRG